MHSASKSLVILVVLATLATSGYAIKCYVCNSQEQKECEDTFDPEVGAKYVKDCSTLQQHTDANGKKIPYSFCRKTTQKAALAGMKEEDKRIIRTCGYLNDTRLAHETGDKADDLKCYRRVGTFEVELLYCACFADECNPAARPHAQFGVAFLGLVASVGIFIRNVLFTHL